MSFLEFFNTLKNAEFTFGSIIDWILSIFRSVPLDPDNAYIWQFIKDSYNSYLLVSSIIAICLAVAIAFFGQKMTGILKFCFFFAVGFSVGVRYLAPIIPESINIKSWIIGLVVAVVVAVLYKYLYYLLLIAAVGYSVYRLAFTVFMTQSPDFSFMRCAVCLSISAVFVIIALIFNKWLERLLTSFLGGYLVAVAFNYGIYRFTSLPFLDGIEWVGTLVIGAVIAIPAFIVQVKKREVY
jgi:hypothetical protein